LLPLGFAVSFLGLIGSCLLVDWPGVFARPFERLPELAGVMAVAGVFNQGGVLLLAYGMTLGHSSVTWVLGQSAIVVPFVFSTVYWREEVGWVHWAGLASVLLSFLLVAGSRRGAKRGENGADGAASRWLLVTACSFVCFGSGQICRLVPSHWGSLGSAGPLRVTIALAASATLFLVLLCVRRQRPERRAFLHALPVAFCMLAGQHTFYKAADALAAHGLAAIAFPLGIGGSMVGFTIYTRLVLKEPFRRTTWAGVAAGTAGIVLLALPRPG